MKIGTIFRESGLKYFLLYRLVELFLLCFILPVFTFLVLRILPGSPFDVDFPLSGLVGRSLELRWQLSSHWTTQLVAYVKCFLTLDFGYSIVRPGQAVSAIIAASFHQSFLLICIGVLLAFGAGIVFSVLAVFSGGLEEKILDGIGKVIISLPTIVVAPLLVYLFSYRLGWVPIAFLDSWRSYILPAVALSLRATAIIYRYLKPEINRVMQSEYIRYGRAKGLSFRYLLVRHALPNALPVIIAFTPSLVIGLVSGAFLVENIFAIPGVASEFVQSLQIRDYPVISALFFCFAIGFFVMTSLCEAVRNFLNPRMLDHEH